MNLTLLAILNHLNAPMIRLSALNHATFVAMGKR